MTKAVTGRPGWVERTADELLGLTPEESALVQLRLDLADAVRERRARSRMTQAELARRTGSTQPRVARLERGDASIEALARAMFVMGAGGADVGRIVAGRAVRRGTRRSARRREDRGGRRRPAEKARKKQLAEATNWIGIQSSCYAGSSSSTAISRLQWIRTAGPPTPRPRLT